MLTPKNKEIFDVKSISFKKVLVTPPLPGPKQSTLEN